MMPGDERKFKRRRMVAFIPTCNCDREIASQTSASDGISTIGVGNGSGTGDSVGGGSGEGVGGCVAVAVGDGNGSGVAVDGMDVALGVGMTGGALVLVAEVSVGDGIPEEIVGPALSVVEGVVGAGESSNGDGKGRRQIRNRNINKRMIATISLKRS